MKPQPLIVLMALMLVLLTGCGGEDPGGVEISGPRPAAGYEVYTHNGGVNRPNNAIDVYIVYSPESEQYMPEIIRNFNTLSSEGKNPVTGQTWAQGERPIYVWGTDPVSGSSGTVAEGVINAIIAPNNTNVYRPTIFQPSVSHWLSLVNNQTNRELFDLANAPETALSPVIIGIWEERMLQLETLTGKSRQDIGWADLLTVLEDGWPEGRPAVYYGHADPRHSSTGLSTSIIEFYACARQNGFTGRRLTADEVNRPEVQECMRNLQELVRHYSRRTEDFLAYFGQGPEYLDMLALEETDLICINTGGSQGEEQCTQPQGGKLVALYPSEGTFWHGHPFGIVQLDASQGGWTTPEQRDAAAVFTDFVLNEQSQTIIMRYGFRPANPDVEITYPFVEENGVLPEGPQNILDVPDITVLNAIRSSWSLVKKQADVMIVIDVSGSMNEDGKIDQAREAALRFLDGMESGNRVGLATFSDDVNILVPLGQLENVETNIASRIRNLRADGGTELYMAISEITEVLNAEENADRVRAVVVLSDGADTGDEGATLNDAINAISASRNSLNPVILVPVAYGSNADIGVLNQLAQASRTSVQSGDPNSIGQLLELLASFF